MSRGGDSPFRPGTVFGLLLFGAIAFVAMLYLIGAGETGRGTNDGGAHGAAKGLTGYAALAGLIEAEGHDVRLSRSEAAFDDVSLLILTPPHFADGEEIARIIESRRYAGPTLLILPKWQTSEIPPQAPVEAEEGWVFLTAGAPPFWTHELTDDFEMEPEVFNLPAAIPAEAPHWRGLGMSGRLPDPEMVMRAGAPDLVPLAESAEGQVLAGWVDDGYYPNLAEASGVPVPDGEFRDTGLWNVTIVAEPDLFNNYGMADRNRAQLALAIVDLAMEGDNLPITFDLTLNGLGRTPNLLTLAFAPPFLAATLCLILAMIVVAWRAFRRFGPPAAAPREIEFGKRTLAENGARLIERSRRFHLLAEPYAGLAARRIAGLLGMQSQDEARIDAALARRLPDAPGFTETMGNLREARGPHEILRAAGALRDIERKLTR